VLSFFLHFSANAQSTGDYQSAASGTWNTATTWQIYNGSAWVAATVAPSRLMV
jgi:type IV secretory pathway VirB3-like protein